MPPDIDTTSVTMTATPTVGEQYMLAPNATTHAGSDVYFGNTEPLPVTVIERLSYMGTSDVRVEGVDSSGETIRQTVAARFLSPVNQPPNRLLPPLPQYPSGTEVLVEHDAKVSRTGGVYFRWNDDRSPVRGTVYSDEGGSTLHVRGPNQPDGAGMTTQAVDRVFVHPIPPEPEPEQVNTWRILRDDTGHGFADGTIVRRAVPSASAQSMGDGDDSSIFVTVGTNTDGLDWESGVSAFISPSTGEAEAYVEPEPEPIAEHGTTPEWPVRLCTQHTGVGYIHYHVTFGTGAFDPTQTHTSHSRTTFEQSGGHTEQGVRYGNAYQVSEWEASRPRDTEPEPEPEGPTPEEVLRLLRQETSTESEQKADEIERLMEQVAEARQRVDDARHERALWLDRLIVRSREVAREQDWCGVYDAGMQELGLPGRHDPHDGVTVDDDEDEDDEPVRETITVEARVEITVNFDDGDFDTWFENLHDVSVSSASNSTDFTFTIDVETEIEVDEDACGCDDVDTDHWETRLPDWVVDNGYEWNIERTECRND